MTTLTLDRGDRQRLEVVLEREGTDPAPTMQFQVADEAWSSVEPDDPDENPAVYGLWLTYGADTSSPPAGIGANPDPTTTLTGSVAVKIRPASGNARDVQLVAFIITRG